MDVFEYNRWSMKTWGWNPFYLGLTAEATDEEIKKAVKRYQASEHGLKVDGWVGPITVRRLIADREADIDTAVKGFLMIAGKIVPVPFRSVSCSVICEMSLVPHTESYEERTEVPYQVTWHWDVTLSAAGCRRALRSRDYSSHGVIDNDGTFYQFLDFVDHEAYHAREANAHSVGIDVSNVVNIKEKYDTWYNTNYSPRPRQMAQYHGRTKLIYGWYPAQIETARQLALVMNDKMRIPLDYPMDERGDLITTTFDDSLEFEGHLAHYHHTKRKWDVAGFPFAYVCSEEE